MSIDIFELLANSKVKKKFPGKIRKKSETFEKLKCWPPCISFCAISQTHLKYWFSVKNYVIWLNSMKFIFYCYAVSLMPGGAWRHFWRQLGKCYEFVNIVYDNIHHIACRNETQETDVSMIDDHFAPPNIRNPQQFFRVKKIYQTMH